MASRATLDKFYFYYFLIHIPVTIFMDSSLVIPPEYQLSITRILLAFHIRENKDFLLSDTELWLKIFGTVELVFQLPYFVLSVLGKLPYKEVWNLVYGVNVVLTTTCCMLYVAVKYESYGLQWGEMIKLNLIYAPYAIIAFVIFVDSFKRLTSQLDSTQIKKADIELK